jgi:hypothetical protein
MLGSTAESFTMENAEKSWHFYGGNLLNFLFTPPLCPLRLCGEAFFDETMPENITLHRRRRCINMLLLSEI